MKTILAAVDSSPISEAVVDEAAKLARLSDGRVVLLTVVQPPVIMSEYAPIMENIAELTTAADKAAGEHLRRMEQRLNAAGATGETVQMGGAPVPTILAEAEKHAADYIIMGSHGHTAFYDLLVGSTTHGVLMRASCPVLIVPPKSKPAREARGSANVAT